MTTDEHPKPQTLLAQIAKLPPVFKKPNQAIWLTFWS